MQNTVNSILRFRGTGLHSGRSISMEIRPASANFGIWFRRRDILIGDAMIPARWDMAEQSPLCTRIVNHAGVSVSTIEHVMAALAGCGVHNALIEIDGPEVPILDGSSAEFVRAILAGGLQSIHAPLHVFEVLRPIEVVRGDARASLVPSKRFHIDFEIDFDDAAIGVQRKALTLSNGTFVRELCDSRTFCRKADVESMHAQGLALGGTLENAVVVDGASVLNPGGLRHTDEAVRHKMLDAVGDLALAGAPIMGAYTGIRAGHATTNALLRALFTTPGAVRLIECAPEMLAHLPGRGVHASEIPAVA
ncbi:UDP-3-O-acyl-N-acetylglucosamine deacetylase [Salinihabitans flavidus]|uniref:UDP-3-O-acyl-N-acetylglucosamine deacetylase n=1 Tax=Salinihabitans flavidus TaxID=569882 RepID=UPI000B883775|nr:UDP-3-O-acyl-N-acetylglucosamine deacetylase [Salinihabitans flavidus]